MEFDGTGGFLAVDGAAAVLLLANELVCMFNCVRLRVNVGATPGRVPAVLLVVVVVAAAVRELVVVLEAVVKFRVEVAGLRFIRETARLSGAGGLALAGGFRMSTTLLLRLICAFLAVVSPKRESREGEAARFSRKFVFTSGFLTPGFSRFACATG